MIAAIQMRGFSPRTYESYLDAVQDLAKFTRRSLDTNEFSLWPSTAPACACMCVLARATRGPLRANHRRTVADAPPVVDHTPASAPAVPQPGRWS
jgi:hypothetical protein